MTENKKFRSQLFLRDEILDLIHAHRQNKPEGFSLFESWIFELLLLINLIAAVNYMHYYLFLKSNILVIEDICCQKGLENIKPNQTSPHPAAICHSPQNNKLTGSLASRNYQIQGKSRNIWSGWHRDRQGNANNTWCLQKYCFSYKSAGKPGQPNIGRKYKSAFHVSEPGAFWFAFLHNFELQTESRWCSSFS